MRFWGMVGPVEGIGVNELGVGFRLRFRNTVYDLADGRGNEIFKVQLSKS